MRLHIWRGGDEGAADVSRVGLRLLWWATAVAVGLGSAWAALRSVPNDADAAGPWRANALAGSPQADLYTRARVALGALLALNREETMYYVARTDSAGRPLRADCSYRVSGPTPKARWWSVTAYAQDLYLFPNEQRRYSVNGQTAVLNAQGHFDFVSGPAAPSVGPAVIEKAALSSDAVTGLPTTSSAPAPSTSAWIPTPGQGGLFFMLRVYNPESSLAAAPGTLQAPTIKLLGACP